MPSLSTRIEDDFISSYKLGDVLKSSTLRLLKSSLKNAEIDKRTKLSDEDIIKIIMKEIKTRHDSISQCRHGGRIDLAEKESLEIHILESYLPKQIDDSEIRSVVKNAMVKLDAKSKKDFGRVMGSVMPEFKGQVDGSRVSHILSSLLVDD